MSVEGEAQRRDKNGMDRTITLPIAKTFWPTCKSFDEPTLMGVGRFFVDIRRTAKSFSGSYPTMVAERGSIPWSLTLMIGFLVFVAAAIT